MGRGEVGGAQAGLSRAVPAMAAAAVPSAGTSRDCSKLRPTWPGQPQPLQATCSYLSCWDQGQGSRYFMVLGWMYLVQINILLIM